MITDQQFIDILHVTTIKRIRCFELIGQTGDSEQEDKPSDNVNKQKNYDKFEKKLNKCDDS